MQFQLESPFQPAGDQPRAIGELVEGLRRGDRHQTLLGATGTGKTLTMAHAIAEYGKPALILCHNKTLASQLYGELKQFLPRNAVELFISYYNYYQPEAYIPSTDTYITKDASVNDDINRLRLRATSSLMEREDVVIVSSVSCIYGLGDPQAYRDMMVLLQEGQHVKRDDILARLVAIQYERNDIGFPNGTFRVRGDLVEIFPAYEEQAIRIEMWGEEIDRISRFDPLTGETIARTERAAIYPARHFVSTRPKIDKALSDIEAELLQRLGTLEMNGQLVEAQRLASRTRLDVEMLRETGMCQGIENYSRHIVGRGAGARPYTLLDYFPADRLTLIDESHVTVPQIRAMYNGDRSRKETLVEHGFRLPSALDNRPLTFEEWDLLTPQTVFVSATPGDYEMQMCGGVVVEQIIRPTGLLDPVIEVRPIRNQVDDLLAEVRDRVEKNERVLVTTLTKRMSEDLSEFLQGVGVKVRYLHSDIGSVERMEIIRGLRLGDFDVLIGVNLLREGLDMPEVSLVAVLDADKEGFLRSERSLIQTVGRAARNSEGRAILYADRVTESMQKVIDETARRRAVQMAHNELHGVTPTTVAKTVQQIAISTRVADVKSDKPDTKKPKTVRERIAASQKLEVTTPLVFRSREELEAAMKDAAAELDFEKAARLRDELLELQKAS